MDILFRPPGAPAALGALLCLRAWVTKTLFAPSFATAMRRSSVSAIDRPPRSGLPRPNCHSHWLISYTLHPFLPNLSAASASPCGNLIADQPGKPTDQDSEEVKIWKVRLFASVTVPASGGLKWGGIYCNSSDYSNWSSVQICAFWLKMPSSLTQLPSSLTLAISETPGILLHCLTWHYIPLHPCALQAITSNYSVITRSDYNMLVMDM